MNATTRWRDSSSALARVGAVVVAIICSTLFVTTPAQADGPDSSHPVSYTGTWTQTESVTVTETATYNGFTGTGSATDSATVTASAVGYGDAAWEAYYWGIWNAWLEASKQAKAAADAKARPVAKAAATADAKAKYDADVAAKAAAAVGITYTGTWTTTETVTVRESATVGDFIGVGEATSTKTVTATATVTYPTNWEAYYWGTMAAAEKAIAQAKEAARAEAQPIALQRAKADAQAQYDAAQVPATPPPSGGTGTTPPPTTTDACGTVTSKSDGSAWQCSFADDFRGTALDTTRWSPVTTAGSGFSYGDCFFDKPANVNVANGTLNLTTRKESAPVTCKNHGADLTTSYTSGSVSTSGKFSQAFGKYEIRAAMPASSGKGLQSALWMLPQNPKYGAWPGSGEIDIAEFYSLYADRLVPALHYNSVGGWATQTNTKCLVNDPTQFHTYGLEWTPTKLKITFDGTTCLDHTINPLAPLTGSAPFDQPFYLNLTQMLGSAENAFAAGEGVSSATLKVDYVKVWK